MMRELWYEAILGNTNTMHEDKQGATSHWQGNDQAILKLAFEGLDYYTT